jgi:hypothetical protein
MWPGERRSTFRSGFCSPSRRLALHTRTPTVKEIEAIHAYTSPARAGYQLAKLITGLPDELLALIGHDQITADAIRDRGAAGCRAGLRDGARIAAAWPQRANPIPRAVVDSPLAV